MEEGHTQFQRGLLDFTRTYDTAAIFSCQRHPQKLMKKGVEWYKCRSWSSLHTYFSLSFWGNPYLTHSMSRKFTQNCMSLFFQLNLIKTIDFCRHTPGIYFAVLTFWAIIHLNSQWQSNMIPKTWNYLSPTHTHTRTQNPPKPPKNILSSLSLCNSSKNCLFSHLQRHQVHHYFSWIRVCYIPET